MMRLQYEVPDYKKIRVIVDTDAACGFVCAVSKDSFSIMTKKGCLVIKEVQLEGKKRMKASAFLLGYPIEMGMQFPN